MRWRFRGRGFTFGADEPVRLMGVLNVTPDSFSDGGRFLDPSAAVAQGLALIDEGADLLDVGGESSRPGAEPVAEAVELARVVPVIRALRARTAIPLSVDTTKPAVAEAALEAGADVINDITGLSGDAAMIEIAARAGAGVVVMHMRGTPRTMQAGDLGSADIVGEVRAWLAERLAALEAAGLGRESICLDPGVGFGKTVAQNLALVAGLPRLVELGRPLLLGLSRKSFLGAVTGRAVGERDHATVASTACAVSAGAHLLRVHAVAPNLDAVRVARALRGAA